MYLKNKKVENIPYNIIAENIDVAIDFLLFFLDANVSNHVNNDKDETSGTGDIYSMRALEKPKDLKALVKSYYKSLKFTPSQFHRSSGGLRFLDSLLSKLNEVLKSKSNLDFLMEPVFDNLERYYKMKMLPPQGWYEQGIFSTFIFGNKIPSWFTKLVVSSILKENLFEHYYVQTAGSEGGLEEEEDNDDSILDYDNDDEDEEATLMSSVSNV
ncbi:hypothetical protein BC332_24493 [Capsicum chinense]|nr:hypothetical protein BC332_24493 [Capsicum chinense]